MRGNIHCLALATAFVGLAAFTVQEAEARGRGGGGFGGGGGFSRGGSTSMSRAGGFNRAGSAMGGGSYGGSGFSRGGSYSRPSGNYSPPATRPGGTAGRPGPSQLPAGGAVTQRPGQAAGSLQRPSQRPVAGQLPGQGGAGAQRPAQLPSNRPSGDRTNISRGDRNTTINRGNVNTGDINIDNNWRGDWHGWGDYPLGAGIVIGATAAWATAVAVGSAFYALPPSCSPYTYYRYTYYNCGGAYYQPQYEGDTIVYVSVPDPATNPNPPPQQ